jgi:hypothetical protein
MSARLFTMQADYEGQPYPQAIYGTSEITLRMIGRDHHRAATIKPVLTLRNPDGTTIATIDEWADDWIDAPEAGA